MFKLLFGLLALFCLDTRAASVFHVDRGAEPSDEVLVFLSNGQVQRLHQADSEAIEEAQIAKAAKAFKPQTDVEFKASILDSLEEAGELFASSRYKENESSQPYQRAHVWAYEWDRDHSVKSMKVWLLFTKKYIRENNFDWWFHVAPMVYVNVEGSVKELMMDAKYTRKPLDIKTWTDIFMRKDETCVRITKFSEYEQSNDDTSCMLQVTNMYFPDPTALKMSEFRHLPWKFWVEKDLKDAYREFLEEDFSF